MADVVYINVEEGLKRVLSNSGLYIKLLNKFKNDTNLNSIKDSLAKNDIEEARSFTHTLKGLTANLSLTEMYIKCLELEDQLKKGSFDPALVELISDVSEQTTIEIDKVIAQYA